MDLYFGKVIESGKIILEDDEFRHLKVVRKNVGDKIQVTDGRGHLYQARIEDIKKHECELIIETTELKKVPSPKLHLAIAPTKNIDRIEWLVEKCVEAGISEFSFVKCRHSERKEVKTDRLNRIAISAIKQSQKMFLPKINEMISFADFIHSTTENQKLICSMEAKPADHLKHSLLRSDAVILIGPEGDFNSDELTEAKSVGFISVSLGPERLRTETAALASCIYFNFINHE